MLRPLGVWLLLAAPAAAEGLQRFDMAQLPLGNIELQGGEYIARLLEGTNPFKSQIFIECQNCARDTELLVGLSTASPDEAVDFYRNPEIFLDELNAVCLAQADTCEFTQSTVGGLKGYAYTGFYPDGLWVVEHVYFSNGLTFVINAIGPSLDIGKTNVATLIRAAGPYVTGEKP